MKYRFFIIILVLAVVMPVFADTVVLKNGRKMVGKVTVTEEQVIVETELGTMAFSRREVERIERDDKTLNVPKKTDIPKKTTGDNEWEVIPDMPYHETDFAELEVGAKIVAYNPRKGIAIFGTVGKVIDEEENRTVKFDSPSRSVFKPEDAKVYTFFKIDTDITLAKLMFFGCKSGDILKINFNDGSEKEMEFKEIQEDKVLLREGVELPESHPVSEVYMVENGSSKKRSLETFLNSKGLSEGDGFTYTETDGTIKMGRLVKAEDGSLELEADEENLKLDWTFINKLEKLDSQEYKLRKLRLKASKYEYSPAVKPGDNIRAAVAAYGKADMEGEGISERIGIKGANMMNLYTRFFSRAGLWISTRSENIYEIQTGKGFTGTIYGLRVDMDLEEALKSTDLYFYRCNVNNPRRMLSETLQGLSVELLLNPKMEKVEKISIYDPTKKNDWAVVGGVIMRRGDK